MAWKAENTLPTGYICLSSIDLIKNKKELRLVTLLSVVLAVGTALWGFVRAPIQQTFVLEPHWNLIAKLCLTAVFMLVYLVGHEAVHGVMMWAVSRVRPHFGFSLMYAYAGSEVYFGKLAYLTIALAPVVVWGVLLEVICAVLPTDWFWVCFATQVFNLSGAAGDFYVVYRVSRMPSDVLIKDTGTSMTAYSKPKASAQA
ncbi:MAG: DUF3267 domain-containing protein [Clostridia bacterium]